MGERFSPTKWAWLLIAAPACSPAPPPPTDVATPTAPSSAAERGDPHPHGDAPAAATALSSSPAVPQPPPLSDVLVREPRGDDRCSPTFPSFWTWDGASAQADPAALERVVWLAPDRQGKVPVTSEGQEQAAAARCIAVGPHRGLNLANWCCRQGASERTLKPPAAARGLVATLAVERTAVSADRELRVTVAIENRGPQPQDLDLLVASATVLLLEVRDAKGVRVPPLPPPTPPVKPEVVSLPPGGGRTFQHPLGVFSPPLPPGTYTVQVGVSAIRSGVLPFRIE